MRNSSNYPLSTLELILQIPHRILEKANYLKLLLRPDTMDNVHITHSTPFGLLISHFVTFVMVMNLKHGGLETDLKTWWGEERIRKERFY